jgi:hypothetical protein
LAGSTLKTNERIKELKNERMIKNYARLTGRAGMKNYLFKTTAGDRQSIANNK